MKNKTTKSFVIFQWPNKYLWIMLLAYLGSLYLAGSALFVARTIFYLAGIIWSYLEIAHGVNWFRKALGAIVMTILILGLLKMLLHIK